jgi:hypothetical protein
MLPFLIQSGRTILILGIALVILSFIGISIAGQFEDEPKDDPCGSCWHQDGWSITYDEFGDVTSAIPICVEDTYCPLDYPKEW